MYYSWVYIKGFSYRFWEEMFRVKGLGFRAWGLRRVEGIGVEKLRIWGQLA